jgi:hypothetical protein
MCVLILVSLFFLIIHERNVLKIYTIGERFPREKYIINLVHNKSNA